MLRNGAVPLSCYSSMHGIMPSKSENGPTDPLESIQPWNTCATEAMWVPVLGVIPQQYRSAMSRQRMRPDHAIVPSLLPPRPRATNTFWTLCGARPFGCGHDGRRSLPATVSTARCLNGFQEPGRPAPCSSHPSRPAHAHAPMAEINPQFQRLRNVAAVSPDDDAVARGS